MVCKNFGQLQQVQHHYSLIAQIYDKFVMYHTTLYYATLFCFTKIHLTYYFRGSYRFPYQYIGMENSQNPQNNILFLILWFLNHTEIYQKTCDNHLLCYMFCKRIKLMGITYTKLSCPTIKLHLRRNQTGKVKDSFPLEYKIQN